MSNNSSNTNKAFQVEGIDIRYKQKPISEDVVASRYIDVDLKTSARIFLHSDGRLYFRDNVIKTPLPLEKLKNVYERIRVEDGELRFFNKELTSYINLSQLTTEFPPYQKNNSLVTSNSYLSNIDDTFDANEILINSYLQFAPSLSGQAADVFTDADIITAQNRFKNAFSTYTVNILEETVIDGLFNNFITGIYNVDPVIPDDTSSIPISAQTDLTLAQLLHLGYESYDDYFSSNSPNNNIVSEDEYTWSNSYILPDMSIFLGDSQIGIYEKDGDILGKKYFANLDVTKFDNYMFENIYKYNGIGKYIHSIFDSPPISGFATTPEVDSEGIFVGLSVNKIGHEVLDEISKVITYTMANAFVSQMHTKMIDANILVNNYFRGPDTLLSSPSLYSIAEQALSAMNNSTFKNTLLSAIDNVFQSEQTSFLKLSDFSEFSVGGIFNSYNILPIDFNELTEQWFDIPNMYRVSPVISNNSAISITTHFPVTIKHRRNTRYEFRLVDTVSGVELDKIQIESSDFENLNLTGDIFSEKLTTHPIQLSYFGPTPNFSCEERDFEQCFKGTTDVLTHTKILSDDCVYANPIGEASGFRNIADRFLENITTEVDKLGTIQIDTPRIFRVQWRCVYLDSTDSILTHQRTLSNMTFSGLGVRNSESRFSLSVYNVGESSDRFLKQGVVQFNTIKRKPVEFDFVLNTENDYSISLSCSKNVKIWYEDKSSHGFTIKSEKTFEGEVTWMISKKPNLKESQFSKDVPPCFVDSNPTFGSISNFDILRQAGYNI